MATKTFTCSQFVSICPGPSPKDCERSEQLKASWARLSPLYFVSVRSKIMPFFSWTKSLSNLASQSTQQPGPVCTWSAHGLQSRSSPKPFPRHSHTLTTTTAGKLFLFGGDVHGRASSDLYVVSTRDFSTTLLQTTGDVPTPRFAHCAALIGTTLLICGGKTGSGVSANVPNHDSLYLLNLGTSVPLMSSPTPADHTFVL